MQNFRIRWKGKVQVGSALNDVSGEKEILADASMDALQQSRNAIVESLQGGSAYALVDLTMGVDAGSSPLPIGEVNQFMNGINAEGGLVTDALIKPRGFTQSGNNFTPVYSEFYWEGRADNGTELKTVSKMRPVEQKTLIEILTKNRQVIIDELSRNGGRYALDYILVKNMQAQFGSSAIWDFFAELNKNGGLDPLPDGSQKPISLSIKNGECKIFPKR